MAGPEAQITAFYCDSNGSMPTHSTIEAALLATVGRGRYLSEEDVTVIFALAKTTAKSISDFAADVGRSKTAVAYVLQRRKHNRSPNRLGRMP